MKGESLQCYLILIYLGFGKLSYRIYTLLTHLLTILRWQSMVLNCPILVPLSYVTVTAARFFALIFWIASLWCFALRCFATTATKTAINAPPTTHPTTMPAISAVDSPHPDESKATTTDSAVAPKFF